MVPPVRALRYVLRDYSLRTALYAASDKPRHPGGDAPYRFCRDPSGWRDYNRFPLEDSTPEHDRLNSWKEIAAYLNVTVRTAQRWERAEHLPVRRHKHAALSSVFAFESELEAWWNSRPDLLQPAKGTPAAMPSIAVLPFANLSREERDEILSDGLTEELINALTRVDGLHVIARTSCFHFKGKTDDVRQVAARLGVSSILEGSVRRSGERLRITAQLIDANDGCHLWSERYDRRAEDLLDLEDEIARAIADALRVKLIGRVVARQSSRDPAAYEHYLEGRYYWNKRTPRGFHEAIRCFEQALARDAGMAPAWAGLADCYAMLPTIGGVPDSGTLPKAKAAALKALEIDSELAEAHNSLASMSAMYDYDWAGAECHFRRALELNPDHASSNVAFAALLLAPLGRLDEAERHVKRASELDPFSAVTTSALAMHHLVSRQFDRAIATCTRALTLDPGYPWAHRVLGECFLLTGRLDEGIGEFLKIEVPAFAAGLLGYCYARSGRVHEARQLSSELQKAGPSLACQLAILDLGLGDRDAACACLDEACQAHSLGVHWLKIDPIWDDLLSDPRFSDLLRKMGLRD